MSALRRSIQTSSSHLPSLTMRLATQPLRRKIHTSPPKHSDLNHIFTKYAMPPVGPYSQAIRTPSLIFVSGQLPASPSGDLVIGTMTEKTAACLRALNAVLEEAGSSLKRVVKVQVFLTNMDDFAEMNEEYARWIQHKPARSCVAVKELPKGVSVEIECVALNGEEPETK